jgi:hypothetical protein
MMGAVIDALGSGLPVRGRIESIDMMPAIAVADANRSPKNVLRPIGFLLDPFLPLGSSTHLTSGIKIRAEFVRFMRI